MTDGAKKIVVAMSGGVDSSVAALLLKQQGFEVTGLFMRSGLSSETSGTRTCCSLADVRDARRVAEQIGVAFYVLNFAEDFDRLIDGFVAEYGRGRTPNPCIICNRDLKFGRLIDYADQIGAAWVATGHYARVGECDGEAALWRGADPLKDQSYALFPISYERLGRIVLPLGSRSKAETRWLARKAGLLVRDKEESQDICFVAGDYVDLIRRRRPDLLQPGAIVNENGKEVGRHEGVAAFTIGQRRGVRIAFGEPRYVVRLDAATATVVVGPREELMACGLVVEDVNWLTGHVPADGSTFEAEVKIRYRHTAAPAEVYITGAQIEVCFREQQRAITPGQAAVFYQGDRVLGGGWIARALTDQEGRP